MNCFQPVPVAFYSNSPLKWVSVAPLSYQIGSMLYIDVVAETDALYQGMGKLWPQPSLLGNELPQTLDGKRVFCANIHSSCRCKDTCTYKISCHKPHYLPIMKKLQYLDNTVYRQNIRTKHCQQRAGSHL